MPRSINFMSIEFPMFKNSIFNVQPSHIYKTPHLQEFRSSDIEVFEKFLVET